MDANPRMHKHEPANEAAVETARARRRSLWFGMAGSAFAWVLLGCFDITVTWRACMLQEDWGVPQHATTATALYLIGALVLLGLTVYAGFTSYQNWRRFATMPDLVETKAVDRHEFMAAAGVLVAITMGMGIVWLALPPLFLDLCWRAR
ncbi:MAG TPA: hypothetical protein VFA99_01510 [Acidobacteriaceae bacterium]|nr:hypothetical protein [Acidobacteriaceae bacterium]